MNSTRTPRVKICCIASIDEAALAVDCGASALGLVSHMPSGPGVIEDQLIVEITAIVPPAIATFLLTSRRSVPDIIEQQRFCRTNTIQICDHLTVGTHRDLKDTLPGISVVQVVHVTPSVETGLALSSSAAGDAASRVSTGNRTFPNVTDPDCIKEAVRTAPHVDAILLDSGNQKLAIKELGGTGRTHDWTLSRAIRERVGIPLFLAGGLTPENVAQAIEEVGPFGLDVCSGVRTDGKLDAIKLKRFFSAVHSTEVW
jgi:phosphoribosylanthranilate isomerase